MSLSSTIFSFCPSRRITLAVALLIAAFIAFAAYDRLISAPERQHVVRRYDEFRAVVAAGDSNRMMQFVAPEFRDWAIDRLHLYGTFARPLDSRSTIRVSAVEATICPNPQVHFCIIPAGHVVKMVKENGTWFMGRVYVD
jgi:hypothetical protein